MRGERLKELERRAAELHNGRQLARITFADGSMRTMPAPDVIPLFQEPEAAQIVSVTGGSKGDGRLVELLAGLLEGGA